MNQDYPEFHNPVPVYGVPPDGLLVGMTDIRISLKVKRVHPDAIIPQYQKDGDACFDLHCISGALLGPHEHNGLDGKGQSVEFRTGLAFEVPPGYGMFIFSRSGHGFNHGVRLANCVGVIDSGYRGEVKVKLHLDVQVHWREGRHYGVMAGDRIAQAMLLPIPMVRFVEVDELSDSERGAGGFGSTGAAA